MGLRIVGSLFALIMAAPGLAQPRPAAAPQCRVSGAPVPVAELTEGSGLAASRTVPGRFWSHNDSGMPVLFALDSQGKVTGQLRLEGAAVADWEAIAVGPCDGGSCIYVGDIGDNEAERDRITVYQVREPEGTPGTAKVANVFEATYPDGAHDAETLLVSPEGRLYIVTKGETGGVALYRFPTSPQAGAAMRLERVGAPRGDGRVGVAQRITDGSMSADGQWIALRTPTQLTLHRAADLLGGNWQPAGTVDLRPLGEQQGEGIAFGAGTDVYVAGEGGGGKRPGTFARLDCNM
jgi:hypothetical protein